jgi:hypothetical protein
MEHSDSNGYADASSTTCKELEKNPGEYQDQFVGIVRGTVVGAHKDFFKVIELLSKFEPDQSQHYVVHAGHPQSQEIFNFGLA